ncbi:hypothetical protein MPH_13804, partial [Macrophomina phaseolina MS6]
KWRLPFRTKRPRLPTLVAAKIFPEPRDIKGRLPSLF